MENWLSEFEIDSTQLAQQPDESAKMNAIRQLLIAKVDELIHHDTERLKWILYRIDVSEKKLQEALSSSTQQAATVIADLIIERQIQKAQSRKQFGGNENDWSFDL